MHLTDKMKTSELAHDCQLILICKFCHTLGKVQNQFQMPVGSVYFHKRYINFGTYVLVIHEMRIFINVLLMVLYTWENPKVLGISLDKHTQFESNSCTME